MKVGYVQNSPIFGEKEKNFAQIEKLTDNIQADLIVLPELFATGYTCISKEEALNLAEKINGDTSIFLQQISQKTGAIIVGGFIEKEGSEIYNSSMMVFKEKIIGTYRKNKIAPFAIDCQKTLSFGIRVKLIKPANSIGPTPFQRVKLKYMESNIG